MRTPFIPIDEAHTVIGAPDFLAIGSVRIALQAPRRPEAWPRE